MNLENRFKTCCVTMCTNTGLNSTVDFFNFPESRYRYFQRNKWVNAIRNVKAKLSTADAVHHLTDYVSEELGKGNQTLGIFLDLAKAFDTVSISTLLTKLETMGIRGTPLKLFADYLDDRYHGPLWLPVTSSVVCGAHFVNGKPSSGSCDLDYVPSVFGTAKKMDEINGPLWLPGTTSVVCGAHFVNGKPSSGSCDLDYVPSVFGTAKKMDEIKSRVSVKQFALEYIKHDALLERPSKTNYTTAPRKCAYVKLAASLGIPIQTARSWDKRFRKYFEQKMAAWPDKSKPVAGTPQWMVTVAQRLYADPTHRAAGAGAGAGGGAGGARGGAVGPHDVVAALAAAARARGTLCSTALYIDVRRALRVSAGINDLHAVWVSAQRVSLEQVGVAGRAGDVAPAPPPHAALVADLVLLHSDVDVHRLVTDESITLFEESAALHRLWQLVQRHRLEEPAPLSARERVRRWSQAHREYLDSGRYASLVVLQRRWHELKLQARERLAAHWRRAALPPRAPPNPPAPPDAPALPPHEMYPRPAPIHISILKRYPHVATGAFKSWRQLVLDGAVVSEPLEPDSNVEEKQDSDNVQSPDTIEPPQLDSTVDQPTVHVPKIEQVSSDPLVKLAKQTSDQIVDEPIGETTVNKALVKQSTTGDPLDVQPEVDKTMDTDILGEKNDTGVRMGAQPNVKVEPNVGSDSTAMLDNAVKPTVNEHMLEKTPSIDPYNPQAEKPTVNNLLADQPSVIKRIDLNELGTKDEPLIASSAVIKPKVEKDTDNPIGQPYYQTTTNKPEVEQTENVLLVDQSKVTEKRTVSDLSAAKTANIDLSAMKSTFNHPKTEGPMDNEFFNRRITKDDPLSSVQLASRAAGLHIADTHDRPGLSSEPIHRAEDMSSAVIPRYLTQANASDSDTDTEDNLVIDEYPNNTSCSLNLERVSHTETQSVDTVSLVNTAPTLAVLQMIDPSTVKTEILFESDEEDFQPYARSNKVKIELDTKKEVSFIADKIKFSDDDARGSCDVTSKCDVTESMEYEDAGPDELHNDTMDPQLLMDTKVLLFRIDKTRAYKNNARKDKSIKVSRIHKRYYTPNPKKYYVTPPNSTTRGKKRGKSGKFTAKPKSTKSTAKTGNKTSNEKQDIEVHNSRIDTVADTASAKQLCKNIKREHIAGEHETPNKRVKTASDVDDDDDVPLLVIKEKKANETADGAGETADDEWVMVEASSSDEDLVDGEIYWEVKRKNGGRSAAATIEWSAEVAGARGARGARGPPGRVAKRVTLPDREQLRRAHTGLRVAQVAPISNTIDSTESLDKDSGAAESTGDAVDDDTPLAWRALDLPAEDQLEAALDELTSASNVEHVMQRSLCCAARRHRHVNDARRRIGIADLLPHTHADGACTCCCAHLSEESARARLAVQEHALHTDIERLLWKSTSVRSHHSKPAQKHSRSPSPTSTTSTTKPPTTTTKPPTTTTKAPTSTTKAPTSTTKAPTSTTKPPTTTTKPPTTTTKPPTTTNKQPAKDLPSSKTTEAKSSKTKPATCSNRSKKKRSKPRPPSPTPAPPAEPVDYYEEWQRQKTLNAQYFYINSPFKKEKTATPQSVAKTTIPQALAKTTAPESMSKTTIPKAVAQTDAQQSMAKATIPQAAGQTTSQQSMTKTTIPQAVGQTASQQSMAETTIPQAVAQTASQQSMAKTTIPQAVAPTDTISEVAQTTARQSMAQTDTPQSVANTIIRPSVIKHSTASSVNPPQTTQAGLMPYIRESRLIAPVETRPMCIEVPTLVAVPYPGGKPTRLITQKPAEGVKTAQTVPKQRTTLRPIAPKPEKLRLVPVALNAVKKEPDPATKSTNDTTAQVTEPQPSTSQSADKPLSILEEYSRTLSVEPTGNIPVVNALSLRVPDGPVRSKTTILMSLTIPSEEIIKQTINTLYTNETVDLTKEPDAPAVKKTKAKTMPPVVDIVAAVKNLITAGNSDRSLLKSSNSTAGGSVLQSHLESLVATSNARNKAPMLMSLSNKLHDGDIIEIDDSSNDSKDSHSSNANRSIRMNKSSKVAKSRNTKIANEITSDTDVSSNEAVDSSMQITSGTINTLNQAINININENSNQAASNTELLNQASTSNNVNKNDNQPKYSKLKKLLETTSNTNFNISSQAVSETIEDTTQADKGTTSDQATSSVDKSNQAVGKTKATKRSVSKTTTSNPKTSNVNEGSNKLKISKESTGKRNPTGVSRRGTDRSSRDKTKGKEKKPRRRRSSYRGPLPSAVQVELTDVAHIQALQVLKQGSDRCLASFANVAAMPVFMAQVRAASYNVGNEVYTLKESATSVAASSLACGETLLCVDASREPLQLPAKEAREGLHLVLTDADLPCVMPSYWTLAPYTRVSRVVRAPDQVKVADGPNSADVPERAEKADGVSGAVIASGQGGARWNEEKGEWVMREDDKKICDKNHSFKILTAFCSADGVRQAARAGAPLYLLHLQSARVIILNMTRMMAGGAMRHHARADVKRSLLWELDALLDEAEIEEQLRERGEVTDLS